MALLTWPADVIGPSSVPVWRLKPMTMVAQSPLTGAVRTAELPGAAAWTVQYRWDRLREDDWRALSAFIARVRGRAGRILLSPPPAAEPRGTGGGAPYVSATSSGALLYTAGWPAGVSGVARLGDYLSYAVGSDRRQLHIVVADVATAADGSAAIAVEPPIRTAPAIGTVLKHRGAEAVMMLKDDDQGSLALTPPFQGALTLDLIEAWAGGV